MRIKAGQIGLPLFILLLLFIVHCVHRFEEPPRGNQQIDHSSLTDIDLQARWRF